jgi:hypothetical protein
MNDAPKTGGTAFPLPDRTHDYPGMTLRDYFAGQALPAVISVCQHDTLVEGETAQEAFARKSFEVADAMIKARDTATKDQTNDT